MAAWMAGAAAAPFSVPLLRAAQFLRQAGLVPKVLLQYITELHDVSVAASGASAPVCHAQAQLLQVAR